mmetsp:Transcript_13774/g.22533  ORF Transcript_13774/g.22533 Transcript_13774/m.22533 type:complete len:140 (-) Transcript_13774:54-473(-)
MSIVSPLIFAGDAALVDLMERAESEIDEALDAADGFHNLGDHEPAAAATRAVRRARHALGRTAGALLRLLPAPLGLRRATELAERYAKRVAADALALDDISMVKFNFRNVFTLFYFKSLIRNPKPLPLHPKSYSLTSEP